MNLPPQVENLSGTIFNGQARLKGGHDARWTSKFDLLWRLELPIEFTFTGPDTLVTGNAAVSPWSVSMHDVAGRVGPSIQILADKSYRLECDNRISLNIEQLSWARTAVVARGRVQINEGDCKIDRRDTITIPAINLDLTTRGADGILTFAQQDTPTIALGTVSLTGNQVLKVRIEPSGARLIPGLPTSAPTVLEYPR